MKHAMNFRLSNQAATALAMLQKKTHLSKTTIIEKALQYYVKKASIHQNVLLEYAGILNNKEADSILLSIQSNKHNKDIDIEL